MSKFCTKCGATLDDNASFCTTCGAKFETAPQTANTANANENATILEKFKANANADGVKKLTSNPNFSKYVGLGAVALVAIILIVVLCSLFTAGYKKTLNKYYDAVEEKDGALLMECYSEYELDFVAERRDIKKKDLEKTYKATAKSSYEYYKEEYGRDFKIKYKVADKEKVEKSDLKDMEEYLQLKFDKKKLKVSKAYLLDLEVTIKGDDDEDTEDVEVYVLKIDGKWCISDYVDPDMDIAKALERLEKLNKDDDKTAVDIDDYLNIDDYINIDED